MVSVWLYFHLRGDTVVKWRIRKCLSINANFNNSLSTLAFKKILKQVEYESAHRKRHINEKQEKEMRKAPHSFYVHLSRELEGTRGNSRELEGTRGNSRELEGTRGNSRELKGTGFILGKRS